MSIIKLDGVVTAMSSISHGAQALGTITYLRRERFLLPSGLQEEIPVISGNAWRGLLRDTASDLWWERVGSPKMTLPVVHALWSGGALAKVAGATLTGSRLASLRKAVPVVGIFGTAGGGRIIDGCLQVGKMIPICKETEHLIPKSLLDGNALPSMWDLTQIEYYSRNALNPQVPLESSKDGNGTDDGVDPIRFGVETFIAGTRFYTWLSLINPTDDELTFFRETLALYRESAKVGGMSRVGHGQIRFDFSAMELLDSESASWNLPSEISNDELRKMLSWLD